MQFRPGTVERMNRNYAGSAEAMTNPYAFPGGHDLSGLPPVFQLDCDRDSLRASGDCFAAELAAAHVPVDRLVVTDSTHGVLNRPASPLFSRAIDAISTWIHER